MEKVLRNFLQNEKKLCCEGKLKKVNPGYNNLDGHGCTKHLPRYLNSTTERSVYATKMTHSKCASMLQGIKNYLRAKYHMNKCKDRIQLLCIIVHIGN